MRAHAETTWFGFLRLRAQTLAADITRDASTTVHIQLYRIYGDQVHTVAVLLCIECFCVTLWGRLIVIRIRFFREHSHAVSAVCGNIFKTRDSSVGKNPPTHAPTPGATPLVRDVTCLLRVAGPPPPRYQSIWCDSMFIRWMGEQEADSQTSSIISM